MTRRWMFWRRRGATPDLTCRELVRLVNDYLEGALADAERARFESHIAGCGNCTAYLAQMRATIGVVGELEPEALDADIERELLAAFQDWKAGGV